MIQFKSIVEIKAHRWAGNHAGDCDAFLAAGHFANQAVRLGRIKDAAEAYRIMGDEGMGAGRDEDKSDMELLKWIAEDDDELADALNDFYQMRNGEPTDDLIRESDERAAFNEPTRQASKREVSTSNPRAPLAGFHCGHFCPLKKGLSK